MFKIYLAVAHSRLEEFLEKNKLLIETKLNEEVDFVGIAVYREGIIQGIKEYHPDVVLIREGIPGSLSLTDLVYQIKIISPTTRIIFIAGDRKPGDAFLATLVQYGVYDILIGSKVNAREMVKKIIYPNKMADVIELMPKIKLTDDGKQLYEAPDIGLLKPILDEQNSDINLKPLEDLSSIKEDESIMEEIIQEEKSEIEGSIKKESIQDDLEESSNESISIEESSKKEEIPSIEEPKPKIQPIKKEESKRRLFGKKINKKMDLDIKKTPIIEPIKEDQIINQQPQTEEPLIPPVEPMPTPIVESIKPYKPVEVMPPEPQVQKPIINMSLDKQNENTKTTPIQNTIPLYEKSYIQQNPYINNIQNAPIEQQPIMTPEGYPPINNMFAPRVNINQEPETEKKGFFFKKNSQKTVSQQIITFVGGRHGCGNSQMAFNIALSLAEQGFKTLYMDLNEDFASVDAILECGFEDLGVDTMLEDIKIGNYPNLVNAINSSTKSLPTMDKKDSMYRTYSKLSPKLELASFSMEILNRKKEKTYDINLLKELNMFLLMNLNYDMIILDAPSNIYSEITKISMIYSNRIFFTLTQDIADTECFMRSLKHSDIAQIGYKDKSNFICNKYMSHTENEVNSIQNQLINFLLFDNFKIVTVPNVYADIVNASTSNVPLLWKVKDKNFKKGIQDIINIILN